MYNKFEHLKNGLTLIVCENVKEKVLEEVYIDTEMFNHISSFKAEWKIWTAASKPKLEKFVGGSNLETGKVMNLKKVIGEYVFGTGYCYTLINECYYDLRKCNILNFKNGTGHSLATKIQIQEKLKEQPPLIKKVDIDTNDSSNNVQVIEYGGKLLILENEKVVNELPESHVKALLNKFHLG